MKIRIITVMMAAAIMSTSCLGSFSAFNGLKDWNQDLSDNKFVNNLVFWGLNIIPVYGIFFLGDAIIFNVIEFWSGSNPIAMNEGEMEKQIIEHKGSTYELTATKNTMNIRIIDGKKKGESIEMFYKPKEKSWNAKKQDGEIIKLSSFEDGFYMVYLPNGEAVKMDPNTNQDTGLAMINSKLMQTDTCYAVAE